MDEEKLTLLSLPDEPMLEVLSYLSIEDMFAAVQACPRLRELTKTHLSLWRGKWFEVEDVDELYKRLLVSPNVDRLTTFCHCMETITADFSDTCAVWGPNARTCLTVRNVEDIGGLVWTLGGGLRHVMLTVCKEDLPLSLLKEAPGLEILYLIFKGKGRATGMWPQGVVLPRLRYAVFDCEPSAAFSRSTLKALRSLLQAHSGQLWSVSVDSPRLMPLLSSCPSDLYELNAVVGEGLFASLRRLHGLKRLRVDFTHDDDSVEEVENLLKSWSGPLAGLELYHFRPGMVRDLGLYGLSSLQKLVLETPRNQEYDLGPALARLPRLRWLGLVHVPVLEVLRGIQHDAIPALEMLSMAAVAPCYRYRCWFEDCKLVARHLPVLQDLVRRAPVSLHVVFRESCDHGQDSFPCRVLHKHSTAESSCCALCTEAKDVYRTYHSSPDDTFKVNFVQVE